MSRSFPELIVDQLRCFDFLVARIIQAAASRLAKKPELAGDIVTAAIEARENEKAEGAVT